MPVALPALVIVLLALIALLFAYAIHGIIYGAAQMIPKNIPVLGDRLRNAFLAIGAVFEAAVQWIMSDFIRPVINIVTGPIVNVIKWITQVGSTTFETAATLAHLITTAIPNLVTRLEAHIAHAVATAEHWALRQLHDLGHALRHLVHLARAYAAHLVAVAVSHLEGLIHGARAYAHTLAHDVRVAALSEVATAKALTRTLVHGLRVDVFDRLAQLEKELSHAGNATRAWVSTQVAKTLAAAEADTAKAVHGAITTVESTAVATLPKVWAGVDDEVKTLEGVLGKDLPKIGAAVRDIPVAVPGDIAAALAGVGALAIPALRYLSECGIPNCRNLSAYGRDLQALLGAVEGGAFVALLVWLVNNPEQAAHDAADVLGPIVSDTADAARSLLGVG